MMHRKQTYGHSRIKSLGVSYLERFMSAINGCHVLSGNHSFNWHLNIIIHHIFEQRSGVRPGLAGEQGDIPTRLYFHPGRNFCHGLF